MKSLECSSSESKPPSYWKQVAVKIGVVLLVYVAVAYLFVPQLWKTYARRRPSFDENPRLTKTSDGHPGDAINVAIVGTEHQLVTIMQTAEWYLADRLGLRNDVKIGVDTILKRSYDEAPVSKLFLDGRPEDFAFEQPVGNDPRHRHHVRFWRSKNTDQGRPIWIGAATFDERVGLSHTTGQITHHTAADIDAEQKHVIDTLQQTNELADTYKIDNFHTQREGKNGGGDRWFTAGALAVVVIKESFKGGSVNDVGSAATPGSVERPDHYLDSLEILLDSFCLQISRLNSVNIRLESVWGV